MRADGIGWGTGEGFDSDIWDILNSNAPTILNEPEAQWLWHDVAKRRSGLTVWRSSPERRPEFRAWDAHAFSRDVFANLDAHHDRTGAYPSEILLLNELNLDYERGDSKGDGGAFDTNPSNWPSLYRRLAAFLADLREECIDRAQDRGFSPRWWFPAWAPGHGEMRDDISAIWTPAVRDFDGVCLHAYTTPEDVENTVRWYDGRFPGKPLLLGEWNSINWTGDRIGQEYAIRVMLRRLCSEIPRLQACYFIYAWAEDKHHEHDIKGNDTRLSLWDGRVSIPGAEPPAEPPVIVPTNPPHADEPSQPDEGTPSMPDYPLGIDVSNNNGAIAWSAVAAAGVQFAVAKITEGTFFRDGYFADNWRGMKAAGLVRGAYHFARPSLSDPSYEAQYMLDAFGLLGTSIEPGDFLALDLEDEKVTGDLSGWTLAWLEYIKARVGFSPLVYTSPAYAQAHGLAAQPEIGSYGLWLASWGVSTPPQAPAPWDFVAIHQTGVGAAGTIAGVSGEIDLNRYNGPIGSLRLYGKPFDAPAPPAPETKGYSIGPGILAKMAESGDSPATDEAYYGGAYSEAFGTSGARYTYIASLGRTFRYDPVA